MCDPISIGVATAALAVGQQVTSFVGQNQAAKANEQAANYNYANQQTIIGQKAVQLDQQKSLNAQDTAIAGAEGAGKIAASASDQGLGNASIVQALNANMFGVGAQAGAEDINDANAREQLANESTGADIARQSQIAKVPKGNPLSLVLGIGDAALKGDTAYNNANKAGS